MKSVLLATTLLTFGLGSAAMATTKAEVLTFYADIAQATYSDSLAAARTLQTAVQTLVSDPTGANLQAARAAWIAAREPYQQSEVFRFGNPIVDDWEGKVNSWPLDEGLIDYVDAAYGGPTDENDFAVLNVIANPSFALSGKTIDAELITPELLADTLHEADGIEANVATGYHAIEFLLWGQDLNGHGTGAGERPATDFARNETCTGGNCDRRAQYLMAATELLVRDLEWMAAQWRDGGQGRNAVTADEDAGIVAMLTGMGSLSYGELAGERMRLGLMLNDPEEEQDCFSDNTHNSHYFDGLGIRNVYLGSYTRPDGSVLSGASLADLVTETDPALDAEMQARLSQTMQALGAIKSEAEAGFAYDQMLERGNEKGEKLIMGGVNALVDQAKTIERVVTVLGLDNIAFEGSESLDNPDAVFQ
ncbi:imelysin family protein [Sedimentitalea nanhaiensis]|uniref:Putative iron-regulated protein n=1 Tax=Sedimentitalea nanhaiensis TaxID=999627 RepID=A0A1I7CJ59_9RHOB|nr:imelysin family protein [Sedimentitalea nanhaiensis]SFT99485.1 putative iron-regulated protein [Sedimentitalea nanhaiensis]